MILYSAINDSMKKILLIISFFVSVCVQAQIEKSIPNPPNPPRLVNDFSKPGLLTAMQKEQLEIKLKLYDDSTSNQLAIVIVNNLDGYSKDEYAIALGRKWGVGGKGKNNGVVILISTGKDDNGTRDVEQRKVFIAVGNGLEGAIPDLTAQSILDNELIPNLKTGNTYRGLEEATDALISAAAGRYTAPAGYANRGKKGIGFFQILLIIIVILFVLSMMSKGGRNGGMMSRRGYRGWNNGGPTIWFPSSGGGWSGGGGSSGGGGFGGFGGGSFGGGGAGGDW